MRSNVPGGESVGEFRTSGVEKAGGARVEGLIERLRARIRVLEQVPVSLAFPPAPDAGLPRPACSLLVPKALLPSVTSFLPPLDGEGGEAEGRAGWGEYPCIEEIPPPRRHKAASDLPTRGRYGAGTRNEVPWNRLAANGLHEIKPETYADRPAALSFALAVLGTQCAGRRGKASPLLWCLTANEAHEWGAPYGPGLFALGIDPSLVLIVEARNGIDAAWALEEGLKARTFIAALATSDTTADRAAPLGALGAQ